MRHVSTFKQAYDVPLKTANGGSFVPSAASARTMVHHFAFDPDSLSDTVLAPVALIVVVDFGSKYTAI